MADPFSTEALIIRDLAVTVVGDLEAHAGGSVLRDLFLHVLQLHEPAEDVAVDLQRSLGRHVWRVDDAFVAVVETVA